MYDIIKNTTTAYNLSDFRLWRVVLAPAHWSRCTLGAELKWCGVKFEQGNIQSIPKNSGVYTFVVKPGIANHPSCSYLLYVGKAEKQVLRARFKQYFKERQNGDYSRRPHVTEMLRKWEGYLWFYYAKVPKRMTTKEVEDQLLAAYLPPSNRTFPCSVRRRIYNLFAQ